MPTFALQMLLQDTHAKTYATSQTPSHTAYTHGFVRSSGYEDDLCITLCKNSDPWALQYESNV
jgi:hypothetical protein